MDYKNDYKPTILNFAFLGSRRGFLEELARKARREEWDFEDEPTKNYNILWQYIKLRFVRLKSENKVCVSSDGQLAAFNTGLFDGRYNDIFACFVPNDNGREAKWKFECFCTAGCGEMGKLLAKAFNPLPQPAKYCGSVRLPRGSETIYADFEQIIDRSIKVLPLPFLRELFRGSEEGSRLVEKIGAGENGLAFDRLKALVKSDSRLFVSIRNRLNDAFELTKKRIRQSPGLAMPFYSAKDNKMALMLPLFLTDESSADAALVVEQTSSDNLLGTMLLTPKLAYENARLINGEIDGWLAYSKVTRKPKIAISLAATMKAFNAPEVSDEARAV